MPYDPKAIANWFIERAGTDGRMLDPMKLQKLVYFAHGWHLALCDEPLMDETVEAWDYGPVVRSLYHSFKEYGAGPIRELGSDLEYEGGTKFRLVVPKVPKSDERTQRLLERIWEVYGDRGGSQLSAMTHVADSPWRTARLENPGVRGPEIGNKAITAYFKSIIAQQGHGR